LAESKKSKGENSMSATLQSVIRRQTRLERELLVWRVLVVIAAGGALLAAASPQTEREIRLASADGKNTVILSAEGLSLRSGGRSVAELSFETVGDGSRQLALLKLNGAVNVESGIISVGSPLKQRAAIRPEGFSLNQSGVVRVSLNPGLLSLADPTGRTKAELTADDQGLTALSLIYDQKLIAQLASVGKFTVTDPPKRDSAALGLNDFGVHPESRLITPAEDMIRGKSKDSQN
jgi:hypothetical protein